VVTNVELSFFCDTPIARDPEANDPQPRFCHTQINYSQGRHPDGVPNCPKCDTHYGFILGPNMTISDPVEADALLEKLEEDLAAKTVPELREHANQEGVELPPHARKADIVEALVENATADPEAETPEEETSPADESQTPDDPSTDTTPSEDEPN